MTNKKDRRSARTKKRERISPWSPSIITQTHCINITEEEFNADHGKRLVVMQVSKTDPRHWQKTYLLSDCRICDDQWCGEVRFITAGYRATNLFKLEPKSPAYPREFSYCAAMSPESCQ